MVNGLWLTEDWRAARALPRAKGPPGFRPQSTDGAGMDEIPGNAIFENAARRSIGPTGAVQQLEHFQAKCVQLAAPKVCKNKRLERQ